MKTVQEIADDIIELINDFTVTEKLEILRRVKEKLILLQQQRIEKSKEEIALLKKFK